VKASSGKIRRSKLRSRDSCWYSKLSAWAMLATASANVGVNCNVAILIVLVYLFGESKVVGWGYLSQGFLKHIQRLVSQEWKPYDH
jgi:hypothetical protein